MPVRFAQNLSVNTDRRPSNALWSRCPRQPFSSDAGSIDGAPLIWFEDDFTAMGNVSMSGAAVAGSAGQWSIYGYQGGQINDKQLEGGVITIGSDGDQEGIALLGSAGSFRFVTTSTLAYNRRMWFEARIAKSTVATVKMDAFVGLMKPTLSSGLPAAAQPITTTDDTLMTAGDLFGFHLTSSTGTRGGPTEVGVAFVLASGTVNYPTNTTTLLASTGQSVLAADTFVKVGWLFDPRPSQKKLITAATARQTAGNYAYPVVRFFVNGLELPTFLTADDVQNATATQAFPTAFMAPVIAQMNTTGASPGTLYADWIAIAQEGNS